MGFEGHTRTVVRRFSRFVACASARRVRLVARLLAVASSACLLFVRLSRLAPRRNRVCHVVTTAHDREEAE
ncbi:MAG: hypothetical protein B6A08_20315, partial [Sorangiineae bacterium NIC37A_2]